ncbi:uncharacterized protein LOC119217615 [Tachysurus ichikawai]
MGLNVHSHLTSQPTERRQRLTKQGEDLHHHLTNAEEMVLSLNAGRPMAEGIPGGTSSEPVTPEDVSAFIKYSYGNICLLEPPVPTEPQTVDDGDDEETFSAATERPTEFPQDTGPPRTIQLPATVRCEAFAVEDMSHVKPPCGRCHQLYSLPGHKRS